MKRRSAGIDFSAASAPSRVESKNIGDNVIFPRIRTDVLPDTILPGANYSVKGIYRRRGEAALVYRIPNRTAADSWYEKGVVEGEWEQAYERLSISSELSRAWFNNNLRAAAAEGPCNYIAIGKVFVFLGIAYYKGGKYMSRSSHAA
jgi:hypothetical protein